MSFIWRIGQPAGTPLVSERRAIRAGEAFVGNGKSFEVLPNPPCGRLIAMNHERGGRFGCLVRMAGIEWRRRVILEPELDSLRNVGAGKLGDRWKAKSIPAVTPPAVKTLPSCTTRPFS